MTASRLYSTLRLEWRGSTAVITFARPEVRNALNRAMVDDLHAALEELATSEPLAALVLTGDGERAFVSGADIAELRDRRRADAFLKLNTGLFRQLELFPAPTIAAIRGYCLGGGCELALACDLRVAGTTATFGQPEVALGIIPGAGATYRLTRLVGVGLAKELIYTGRLFDAAEALRIGLINRIVADDAVLDAALDLASEIAKNSSLAVRLAKQSIQVALECGTDVAMALESTAQAVLFEDAEKQRRMTAFLNRRMSREAKPEGSGKDSLPSEKE